jgi:hypothetical protein
MCCNCYCAMNRVQPGLMSRRQKVANRAGFGGAEAEDRGRLAAGGKAAATTDVPRSSARIGSHAWVNGRNEPNFSKGAPRFAILSFGKFRLRQAEVFRAVMLTGSRSMAQSKFSLSRRLSVYRSVDACAAFGNWRSMPAFAMCRHSRPRSSPCGPRRSRPRVR